jgi:hypothetical protein
MIAGIILLLVGLVMIGVGIALPRLALKLHAAIGTVPTALQGMASMVPGLGIGLTLLAWLPRIARISLGVGGLFMAFSIYAFTVRPTPFWITAFAYLMILALCALGVGLMLILKRYAPMLRDLSQFTKGRL